jgi:MoxR-like ATPase
MSSSRNHRFHLFQGGGPVAESTEPLPKFQPNPLRDDPAFYQADPGLVHAVNAAIALGRPLLVTGEPGTGKTQLAHRIAHELTPGAPPLRFQVTSRSEASHLFYRYDALRHFQEVHVQGNKSAETLDFVRMEALGIAILRAAPDKDRERANARLKPEHRTDRSVRSGVLIDEIDKAPRDLPNDMLAEIENMSFEILETGDPFQADQEFRPVVLFTSNSERDLPHAFLRRCVYYHIKPPDPDALRKIVRSRLPALSFFTPERLDGAIRLYEEIRDLLSARKPSTDALIAWVELLELLQVDPANPEPNQLDVLRYTCSVLAKEAEELETVREKLAPRPAQGAGN